jgi:NADH-quinone oxidoreductase subunit K
MTLSRKHIIIILISLELLLLSSAMLFIISGIYFDDFLGQVYALSVLTAAAAESALGLAIMIVYYRLRGGIMVELTTLLKA